MDYTISFEVSWLDVSRMHKTMEFDDHAVALRYARSLHDDYLVIGAVLLTQTITIATSVHVATWMIRRDQPCQLMRYE